MQPGGEIKKLHTFYLINTYFYPIRGVGADRICICHAYSPRLNQVVHCWRGSPDFYCKRYADPAGRFFQTTINVHPSIKSNLH